MSILSDNLKHLRAKAELSQQALANKISVSRGAYQKYEEAKSEPPLEVLVRISNYYIITVDILIKVDLSETGRGDLIKLNNRMLFPLYVNDSGKERIELISKAAKAGYTTGYGDPEFIGSLDTLSLPFLGSGKYRAFPISGDSMMPQIKEGDFVVGRFLEQIKDVKDGHTYIVLSREDGIVYKRLKWNMNQLELHSDNRYYDAYTLPIEEIVEVWEFACAFHMDDTEEKEVSNSQLLEMIMELKGQLSTN